MAIASRYPGTCKDCGTTHAVGDMIDKNGNESLNKEGVMKAHWCKNGMKCKAAQGLQSSAITSTSNDKKIEYIKDPTPQQSIPQTPKLTVEELAKQLNEVRAKYDTPNVDSVYQMIGLYLETRAKCELVGIYEPAVIGMILNNVIRSRQ